MTGPKMDEVVVANSILLDADFPCDVVIYRRERPMQIEHASFDDPPIFTMPADDDYSFEVWFGDVRVIKSAARPVKTGHRITYDAEKMRKLLVPWAQDIVKAANARLDASHGSAERTGSRGWIERLFRRGRAA